MPENAGSVRIARLILVPLIITLGITLLRLWGELHQWNSALFNRNAGGLGAIVGIAWLPFIFGPYFAAKLSAAGEVPAGAGKVIGYALVGIVVFIGGAMIDTGSDPAAMRLRTVLGLLLFVAAGAVQFMSWGTLAKTLLAYGFGARLPVAIVMFYAIQGNWHTHYDAVQPGYAGPTDLMGKFAVIALIPQFLAWIPYTMLIGSLAAGVYLAIARRGKMIPQPA